MIEISFGNSELIEAINRVRVLLDSGSENSPEMLEAMRDLMNAAPVEMVQLFAERVRALRLLPDPLYTDSGEALYRASDIAKILKISIAELRQVVEGLGEDEVKEIDESDLHRMN